MKTGISYGITVGICLLAGCQAPDFGSGFSKRLGLSDSSEPEFADSDAESNRPNQPARTSRTAFAGESSGIFSATGSAGDNDAATAQFIRENLERGHAEAAQNRLSEAIVHYQRVLEKQPKHTEAHHRLAIIADQQRDFETAERHYRTALEARGNDPNILSDFGWSYILQGKLDDAEERLLLALAFDKTHRRALERLGYLYAQQNDYDRALEMFRRGSTEAEAQAKIALVFPQGRPQVGQTPAGSGNAQFTGAEPAIITPNSMQSQFQQEMRPIAQPLGAQSQPQPQAVEGGPFGMSAAPPRGVRDFAAFPGESGSNPNQPSHVQHAGGAQLPQSVQFAGRTPQQPSTPFGTAPAYGEEATAGMHSQRGMPASTPPNSSSQRWPDQSETSESRSSAFRPANANPLDSMPYFPANSSNESGRQGAQTGDGRFPVSSEGDQYSRQSDVPYGRQILGDGLQPAGYDQPALQANPSQWPISTQQSPPDRQQQQYSQQLNQSPTQNALPQWPGNHQGVQQQSAPPASYEAQRAAAFAGMNAGPDRMFPIINPNGNLPQVTPGRRAQPPTTSGGSPLPPAAMAHGMQQGMQHGMQHGHTSHQQPFNQQPQPHQPQQWNSNSAATSPSGMNGAGTYDRAGSHPGSQAAEQVAGGTLPQSPTSHRQYQNQQYQNQNSTGILPTGGFPQQTFPRPEMNRPAASSPFPQQHLQDSTQRMPQQHSQQSTGQSQFNGVDARTPQYGLPASSAPNYDPMQRYQRTQAPPNTFQYR